MTEITNINYKAEVIINNQFSCLGLDVYKYFTAFNTSNIKTKKTWEVYRIDLLHKLLYIIIWLVFVADIMHTLIG